MSRRSRRGKVAAESRPWRVIFSAVAAVAILGLGVSYALLRNYLHSESFRHFLSAEASKSTGVVGEFSPFHWDGLAVRTDSFTGQGAGPITAVRLDGVQTEVGLGGVRRGVWEISGASIRRLEVTLDAARNAPPAAAPTTRPEESFLTAWFPQNVEISDAEIGELALNAQFAEGNFRTSGISAKAEPAGSPDSYRLSLRGGLIQTPFPLLPELRLDHARLRFHDTQLYLSDSQVSVWKNGQVHATGECDLAARTFSLEGEATGIQCEEVLNADWSKRLTGNATSQFTLTNLSGATLAKGNLQLQNATLTALPMLDALAAYADTRRFRLLNLTEARTDWQWQNGETSITNLVLASEGLIRLEGEIVIRGQEIDGHFRLGLAPGTLATIPGAETDVFTPGPRNLLWAPLHLTGTLENPKEDLTDRLITAAGMRMLEQLPETGEKVLKFTHSVVQETSTQAAEQGVKLIDQGSDAVREVGGILNNILGGGSPVPPIK